MAGVTRVQNLVSLALDPSGGPPGHSFSAASLTESFGAVATGMGVYDLEPGNATWPYHFETTEEEWLIVVEGELTLRTPEGEAVLRAGDVACFPAGAAGAHAVRNHTDTPVRYAMPSTHAPYGDACVYPDSGKVHVAAAGFNHRGRLGEPVDYWEGEQ
ncbi:MAG TPA: cupin domain-containing protein [Gaiellaceae bacterium]|nr:cupin domain-containing protein [Gaiellaceae bacterium]